MSLTRTVLLPRNPHADDRAVQDGIRCMRRLPAINAFYEQRAAPR